MQNRAPRQNKKKTWTRINENLDPKEPKHGQLANNPPDEKDSEKEGIQLPTSIKMAQLEREILDKKHRM